MVGFRGWMVSKARDGEDEGDLVNLHVLSNIVYCSIKACIASFRLTRDERRKEGNVILAFHFTCSRTCWRSQNLLHVAARRSRAL